MGVGGGRRPFFMPRRPRNGPQRRRRVGRDHTRRMQKPPENRVKTAIPGVICKEGAARRRPGSHSSRPKRTSFAALEDSIADGAANGKGVRRANEALERANFARKPGFLAPIGEDVGVRGPCEACEASAQKPGEIGTTQSDIFTVSASACPIARFPGHFRGFRPIEAQYSNRTQKRFITKSKQRKKSGGSIPGIKALGRAAFFVAAPFGIRPVDRLHLFLNVLFVFEVNKVK